MVTSQATGVLNPKDEPTRRRKVAQPRRFKVLGQDLVGTEMSREGTRITLMCAPVGWPFVRAREFDRTELLRLDNGEAEPAAKEGAA